MCWVILKCLNFYEKKNENVPFTKSKVLIHFEIFLSD